MTLHSVVPLDTHLLKKVKELGRLQATDIYSMVEPTDINSALKSILFYKINSQTIILEFGNLKIKKKKRKSSKLNFYINFIHFSLIMINYLFKKLSFKFSSFFCANLPR